MHFRSSSTSARPSFAVVALGALSLTLAACEDAPACEDPNDVLYPDGTCRPAGADAGGTVDGGGADAGPDEDGGACACDGGVCDGTTCVECTEHEHCASDEYCTADNACETGCRDDDGCPDPTAPTCNEGSCEAGCGSPSDCSRFADTPYCDTDSGECVECTIMELCSGSGETCDLSEGVCVEVAPESLEDCRACTNDRQCAGDRKCVPMDFEGGFHGTYCLRPALVGGCERPFAFVVSDRVSVNGLEAADYCGVNEELTTCEAAIAFDEFRSCASTACPEGGLCRAVGVLTDTCTIPCSTSDQCMPDGNGRTCGDGGGTGPDYCGG